MILKKLSKISDSGKYQIKFCASKKVELFKGIHSSCSLSYDRSVASSKASSPQGAI